MNISVVSKFSYQTIFIESNNYLNCVLDDTVMLSVEVETCIFDSEWESVIAHLQYWEE